MRRGSWRSGGTIARAMPAPPVPRRSRGRLRWCFKVAPFVGCGAVGVINSFRQTLFHFARESVLFEPWAKTFYRRKRAQGKTHAMALRALGEYLGPHLYAMWTRRTPSDRQPSSLQRGRLMEQRREQGDQRGPRDGAASSARDGPFSHARVGPRQGRRAAAEQRRERRPLGLGLDGVRGCGTVRRPERIAYAHGTRCASPGDRTLTRR